MTLPMEYFFKSKPQNGSGPPTQESGDAGYSSNMEHKICEKFNPSGTPVADTGSFVQPIPKGEPYIPDYNGIARKIWSYPVSIEETEVLTQLSILPPQATAQFKNGPQVSPGTKALAEAQLDTEDEEQGDSIIDCVMPKTKPKKSSPPIPLEGGKSNHHKRITSKKMYLLYLMALVHASVSDAFPVAEPAAHQNLSCYSCKDLEKCPKLDTIYKQTDKIGTPLYKANHSQTFPGCSGHPTPAPGNCTVCQSNLTTIICSGVNVALDVENSDGDQIVNIKPAECPSKGHGTSSGLGQQISGRGRYGLIAGVVLIIILAVLMPLVLLVRSRCKKRRVENGRQ